MIVLVALAVPLLALAPVTTAYRHRRSAQPPAPMPLREWLAAEVLLVRARWRGRRSAIRRSAIRRRVRSRRGRHAR